MSNRSLSGLVVSLCGLLCLLCLHCQGPATCESDEDCREQPRPSVCVEGLCALQVCQAGATQECYDQASCSDQSCSNRGVGLCVSGLQVCMDGTRWSSCFASQGPQVETCDGADNDCDGMIDEGLECSCRPQTWRACYTGTPRQKRQSPCYEGVQICLGQLASESGTWSDCQGQMRPQDLPAARIANCQIRDVDCDGKADDLGSLCSCPRAGETRPCTTAPRATPRPDTPCRMGTQTCSSDAQGALRWGPCLQQILPTPEELGGCNGKDDDCDGHIDNVSGAAVILYRPCAGVPPKDCKLEICEKGRWSPCQVREVCANHQDDNCDGKLDEVPCASLP